MQTLISRIDYKRVTTNMMSTVRQYMWGSDLSGTRQGAGEVGGLLKVNNSAKGEHFFPTYDGNGNATGLLLGNDSTYDNQ